MSEYTAKVVWERSQGEPFVDDKYSRAHEWIFDGGFTVAASASPHIVPQPYAPESHVDPEEAFVASLSSCHMLFFLAFAARKKWTVDSYEDNASGIMEKSREGKTSITKVTLRPKVVFSGEASPTLEQIEKVHDMAHKNCFIANSVTSEVTVEIVA